MTLNHRQYILTIMKSKAEVIQEYQFGADRNIKTARDLVKQNHRDWALFIGQLSLEKLLKGLVAARTNEVAPRIHDLNKLAELAEIKLNPDQREDFAEITQFHIQARYEEIKYEFYKKATPNYTRKWFKKIEEYYQWLKKLY